MVTEERKREKERDIHRRRAEENEREGRERIALLVYVTFEFIHSIPYCSGQCLHNQNCDRGVV